MLLFIVSPYIGFKELEFQPSKFRASHFFSLFFGNLDDHCYLPNSVLLFNFAEQEQEFPHHNSSEQWKLSKFDIGANSRIDLYQPPQHHEFTTLSTDDHNVNLYEYGSQENITFDISASDDTIPSYRFNTVGKSSQFVTKEEFNADKHYVESTTNVNDSFPQNPVEFLPSRAIRSLIPSNPNFPNCLRPYLHKSWFKELFPNLESHKFPEDSSTCISMILSACSLRVHQKTISAALRAISKIESDFTLSTSHKHHCARMILHILLNCRFLNHPSFVDNEFVFTYLVTLERFCHKHDVQFLSLLIFNFILGNFDIRLHVLGVLEKYGFFDPFKNLTKELDSWDIQDVKKSLQYSILIDRIILWWDEISADTSPLTKTPSIANNVLTYIDALNRFVKCSRERISKTVGSRQSQSSFTTNDARVSSLRSVISLPKIYANCNSVRLGQTHFSRCHTGRESSFIDHQQIMLKDSSQYPFLHIPIHYQNIQLPALYEERERSVVVNNRKKYFVISQSYSL